MERIRSCTPDDIECVAGLFQKVFRKKILVPVEPLKAYLKQIYFEHPWYRSDMPSLVYEDSMGTLLGFLGVLPLHVRFRGKPILAGIGGNYMVDPALKNPLAGPRILKKFLSGPQDLSMSDTGNDIGRKMWEGLGGTVSYLQSIHWIRPLQPTQLVLHALEKKKPLVSRARFLTHPLSAVCDRISSALSWNPLHLVKPDGYVKEISVPEILESMQIAFGKRTLIPDYTESTLRWILTKAGEKQEFGPLRSMGVFSANHSLMGWFLYYPNAGNIGQVLQVGTRIRSLDAILGHLLFDALAMKSTALIGRMDALFMKEFSAKLCFQFHRSNYFVMHSREKEILYAIQNNDAFLTRLEGEWWTRLQGDTFF